MDFSCKFYGYYTILVKESDYKRLLNICTYHGISFWDVDVSNGCTFYIRCDKINHLKEAAEKINVSFEIINISGFPVLYHKWKEHIWFFAGAVIALFLLINMSHRLWNIEIIGNSYYGPDTFNRFLKDEGIKLGMPVNKIVYPQLSADIREKYDRITWASCEIDGCRLNIYVKENKLLKESEINKVYLDKAYDLIADKEGLIHSIYVRSGIAKIQPGQYINKNDVLISGLVPILNDAMEITSYRSVKSDGDIILLREYAYFYEIERKYYDQVFLETRKVPFLQIGQYRFKLNYTRMKKGSNYETLLYDKKKVSVFEAGYYMQNKYEKIPRNYSDEQLIEMGNTHFQEFCSNLLKKGVQIYENNVKINLSDVSCILSGKLVVLEKTGVQKATQVEE